MVKFFPIAATAAVVAIGVTSATSSAAAAAASANDSCVAVDFTAESSEFDDLNSAIDLVTSANMVGTMLADYDPLSMTNVEVDEFSYTILGMDLKFKPTIDSLNVTGLSSLKPMHVNVSSANSVDLGVYSDGAISMDATLTIVMEDYDTTVTADVSLALAKPSVTLSVEVEMLACASDASGCTDLTVMGVETQAVDAAMSGDYSAVLDTLLARFKSVSVLSVALDFASVTKLELNIDSSSDTVSTLASKLTDISADEMNEKGDVYNSFMSTANGELVSVLNDLISSELGPLFGATCLA